MKDKDDFKEEVYACVNEKASGIDTGTGVYCVLAGPRPIVFIRGLDISTAQEIAIDEIHSRLKGEWVIKSRTYKIMGGIPMTSFTFNSSGSERKVERRKKVEPQNPRQMSRKQNEYREHIKECMVRLKDTETPPKERMSECASEWRVKKGLPEPEPKVQKERSNKKVKKEAEPQDQMTLPEGVRALYILSGEGCGGCAIAKREFADEIAAGIIEVLDVVEDDKAADIAMELKIYSIPQLVAELDDGSFTLVGNQEEPKEEEETFQVEQWKLDALGRL